MFPFFYIFGQKVSVYLTCISIAFIAATWLFRRNLMSQGYDKYAYLIPSFGAYILGFFGSGILATLELGSFKDLFTLGLFSYGLSVLGGILAVALGFVIYAWRFKKSLLDLFSAVAGPLFLGYAIGRLACFFAGDGCYGVASDLPWAMAFPNGLHPVNQPVHPTPLYESFMAVWVFAAVQWLFTKSKSKVNQWRVIAVMIAGLAIPRFFVEFLRRNHSYGDLTQAQWISIALLVLAVFLFVRKGFPTKPQKTAHAKKVAAVS